MARCAAINFGGRAGGEQARPDASTKTAGPRRRRLLSLPPTGRGETTPEPRALPLSSPEHDYAACRPSKGRLHEILVVDVVTIL